MRRSATSGQVLHTGQLLQTVVPSCHLGGIVHDVDLHQPLCVVAAGNGDEVSDLARHDESCGYEHYRHRALYHNECLAQPLVAAESESSPHHIDGLAGRQHGGGDESGQQSQQQHKGHKQQQRNGMEQDGKQKRGVEQPGHIRCSGPSQQQGYSHRERAEYNALQNEAHHDVDALRAKQPQHSHLAGPIGRLGIGEVDIIEHGEQQDDKPNQEERVHELAVTLPQRVLHFTLNPREIVTVERNQSGIDGHVV